MRVENECPRRNSLSVFFFQTGLIARNKRITEETYVRIRDEDCDAASGLFQRKTTKAAVMMREATAIGKIPFHAIAIN